MKNKQSSFEKEILLAGIIPNLELSPLSRHFV